MNEILEQYIIDFCENYLDNVQEEYGVIVLSDIKIIAESDNKFYKAFFDVCFFRNEYIYDVTSYTNLSNDEYANEVIDNVCSKN